MIGEERVVVTWRSALILVTASDKVQQDTQGGEWDRVTASEVSIAAVARADHRRQLQRGSTRRRCFGVFYFCRGLSRRCG